MPAPKNPARSTLVATTGTLLQETGTVFFPTHLSYLWPYIHQYYRGRRTEKRKENISHRNGRETNGSFLCSMHASLLRPVLLEPLPPRYLTASRRRAPQAFSMKTISGMEILRAKHLHQSLREMFDPGDAHETKKSNDPNQVGPSTGNFQKVR